VKLGGQISDNRQQFGRRLGVLHRFLAVALPFRHPTESCLIEASPERIDNGRLSLDAQVS
jgi:hypothetical protein